MAARERHVRISKYLSLHLRHRPQALGLTLGPGGWVDIETLLTAARKRGMQISRTDLDEVVVSNDKQRFAISDDGLQIRANQGHSVSVDLELKPTAPPAVLYHGTGEGSVLSIQRDGLKKMRRHHVHLSPDAETARRVGMRHGRPSIFTLDAAQMAADGHIFYVSENGVWLTDSVPSRYLKLLA